MTTLSSTLKIARLTASHQSSSQTSSLHSTAANPLILPISNGPSTAYVKSSPALELISPADHEKLNSTIFISSNNSSSMPTNTSTPHKSKTQKFLFRPDVLNINICSTLIHRPLHALPRSPFFRPANSSSRKNSPAVFPALIICSSTSQARTNYPNLLLSPVLYFLLFMDGEMKPLES